MPTSSYADSQSSSMGDDRDEDGLDEDGDTSVTGAEGRRTSISHQPPRGSRKSARPGQTGADGHFAGTAQVAPPPRLENLPLPGTNPEQSRFVLTVRQHPKQGRQCGFGVKDKRPLDPLPIVQLQVYRKDKSIDEEASNSPNLLMQVSLQRVDVATGNLQETTLVGQPSDTSFPWTRMLEGRLAASAHVVRDLDGSRACFFVFTDLSVRLEGHFRLHFQLLLLGPPSMVSNGDGAGGGGGGGGGTGSNVVAEIQSDIFTIYSPRRFPGMTESTELAKSLARQGVQIPIRNDVRRKQE
ncbi:uncharacterized protein PSFLO_04523 [Pseudozyma flocculosa]|nr:uncharacterized protein PSFLO_04523 [Pseudozyma flocculosa]